jgi:hypothetical protein
VRILAKNSPNSGLQGAYVMATSNCQSIIVPSESVAELFDALSALPRLTRCRKCDTELLHLDATFFSDDGKVWTLPVPFCSTCCLGEGAATNAA